MYNFFFLRVRVGVRVGAGKMISPYPNHYTFGFIAVKLFLKVSSFETF
jgi:hypothetical protein